MDLKEFTKQTLIQIVEGSEEANRELAFKGAYIPYTNLQNCNKAYSVDEDRVSRLVIDVDFDVAITASESEGANGGAGLKVVGLFKAGGSVESKTENQTISRIKYSLPLVLVKESF